MKISTSYINGATITIELISKIGVVNRYKMTLEGATFAKVSSPNWMLNSNTEVFISGKKALEAIDTADIRISTPQGVVKLSKWNLDIF